MWGPFMSCLLRVFGCSGGPLFGRPGGLGRRMEARRPELRHRVGGAPGQALPPGRPGSPGSRCFIGISLGLALVEGLPAAPWAAWVPDCLMCAPSVERGGGGNGWADGLTGGALRAGLEPPTKTSGESCCLEQCRPDAESPGPFSSGVGQRCRGGPQSNGKHALHQQGLPPGGGLRWWPRYRRCWADPMTDLANASTMGLTSRRGLGGRCGGSGVKSGRRRWSPWGLAGAFSGLDIASVPEW